MSGGSIPSTRSVNTNHTKSKKKKMERQQRISIKEHSESAENRPSQNHVYLEHNHIKLANFNTPHRFVQSPENLYNHLDLDNRPDEQIIPSLSESIPKGPPTPGKYNNSDIFHDKMREFIENNEYFQSITNRNRFNTSHKMSFPSDKSEAHWRPMTPEVCKTPTRNQPESADIYSYRNSHWSDSKQQQDREYPQKSSSGILSEDRIISYNDDPTNQEQSLPLLVPRNNCSHLNETDSLQSIGNSENLLHDSYLLPPEQSIFIPTEFPDDYRPPTPGKNINLSTSQFKAAAENYFDRDYECVQRNIFLKRRLSTNDSNSPLNQYDRKIKLNDELILNCPSVSQSVSRQEKESFLNRNGSLSTSSNRNNLSGKVSCIEFNRKKINRLKIKIKKRLNKVYRKKKEHKSKQMNAKSKQSLIKILHERNKNFEDKSSYPSSDCESDRDSFESLYKKDCHTPKKKIPVKPLTPKHPNHQPEEFSKFGINVWMYDRYYSDCTAPGVIPRTPGRDISHFQFNECRKKLTHVFERDPKLVEHDNENGTVKEFSSNITEQPLGNNTSSFHQIFKPLTVDPVSDKNQNIDFSGDSNSGYNYVLNKFLSSIETFGSHYSGDETLEHNFYSLYDRDDASTLGESLSSRTDFVERNHYLKLNFDENESNHKIQRNEFAPSLKRDYNNDGKEFNFCHTNAGDVSCHVQNISTTDMVQEKAMNQKDNIICKDLSTFENQRELRYTCEEEYMPMNQRNICQEGNSDKRIDAEIRNSLARRRLSKSEQETISTFIGFSSPPQKSQSIYSFKGFSVINKSCNSKASQLKNCISSANFLTTESDSCTIRSSGISSCNSRRKSNSEDNIFKSKRSTTSARIKSASSNRKNCDSEKSQPVTETRCELSSDESVLSTVTSLLSEETFSYVLGKASFVIPDDGEKSGKASEKMHTDSPDNRIVKINNSVNSLMIERLNSEETYQEMTCENRPMQICLNQSTKENSFNLETDDTSFTHQLKNISFNIEEKHDKNISQNSRDGNSLDVCMLKGSSWTSPRFYRKDSSSNNHNYIIPNSNYQQIDSSFNSMNNFVVKPHCASRNFSSTSCQTDHQPDQSKFDEYMQRPLEFIDFNLLDLSFDSEQMLSPEEHSTFNKTKDDSRSNSNIENMILEHRRQKSPTSSLSDSQSLVSLKSHVNQNQLLSNNNLNLSERSFEAPNFFDVTDFVGNEKVMPEIDKFSLAASLSTTPEKNFALGNENEQLMKSISNHTLNNLPNRLARAPGITNGDPSNTYCEVIYRMEELRLNSEHIKEHYYDEYTSNTTAIAISEGNSLERNQPEIGSSLPYVDNTFVTNESESPEVVLNNIPYNNPSNDEHCLGKNTSVPLYKTCEESSFKTFNSTSVIETNALQFQEDELRLPYLTENLISEITPSAIMSERNGSTAYSQKLFLTNFDEQKSIISHAQFPVNSLMTGNVTSSDNYSALYSHFQGSNPALPILEKSGCKIIFSKSESVSTRKSEENRIFTTEDKSYAKTDPKFRNPSASSCASQLTRRTKRLVEHKETFKSSTEELDSLSIVSLCQSSNSLCQSSNSNHHSTQLVSPVFLNKESFHHSASTTITIKVNVSSHSSSLADRSIFVQSDIISSILDTNLLSTPAISKSISSSQVPSDTLPALTSYGLTDEEASTKISDAEISSKSLMLEGLRGVPVSVSLKYFEIERLLSCLSLLALPLSQHLQSIKFQSSQKPYVCQYVLSSPVIPTLPELLTFQSLHVPPISISLVNLRKTSPNTRNLLFEKESRALPFSDRPFSGHPIFPSIENSSVSSIAVNRQGLRSEENVHPLQTAENSITLLKTEDTDTLTSDVNCNGMPFMEGIIALPTFNSAQVLPTTDDEIFGPYLVKEELAALTMKDKNPLSPCKTMKTLTIHTTKEHALVIFSTNFEDEATFTGSSSNLKRKMRSTVREDKKTNSGHTALRKEPQTILSEENFCGSGAEDTFTGPITDETFTGPTAEGTFTEPTAEGTFTEPTAEGTFTEPTAEGTFTEPTAEETFTEPTAEETFTEPTAEETFTEPTAEETFTEPTAEETFTEPTAEETFTEPTAEETFTEPTAEETFTEPTAEETFTEPTAEETFTEPTAEEKFTEPTAEEKFTEPTAEETFTEPTAEETFTEPTAEETFTEPTAEETFTEPTAEETFTEPTAEETFTEPTAEETFTEPTAEETFTEPTAEETFTEPTAEETFTEPTAEETFTEPIAEETFTEPIVEETFTEPIVEETFTEPIVEETFTEPIVEETFTEPIVEETFTEAHCRGDLHRAHCRGDLHRALCRGDLHRAHCRGDLHRAHCRGDLHRAHCRGDLHRAHCRGDLHRAHCRGDLHRAHCRGDLHRAHCRGDLHRAHCRGDLHRAHCRGDLHRAHCRGDLHRAHCRGDLHRAHCRGDLHRAHCRGDLHRAHCRGDLHRAHCRGDLHRAHCRGDLHRAHCRGDLHRAHCRGDLHRAHCRGDLHRAHCRGDLHRAHCRGDLHRAHCRGDLHRAHCRGDLHRAHCRGDLHRAHCRGDLHRAHCRGDLHRAHCRGDLHRAHCRGSFHSTRSR